LRKIVAKQAAANHESATELGKKADGPPAAIPPNFLDMDNPTTVVPVAAQASPNRDGDQPAPLSPMEKAAGLPTRAEDFKAPIKDESIKPRPAAPPSKAEPTNEHKEETVARPPLLPPPPDFTKSVDPATVATAPKQEPVVAQPPAPLVDSKPKDPAPPAGNSNPVPGSGGVGKELTNPNLAPMGSEFKKPLPAIRVLPVPSQPANSIASSPQVKSYEITTYVCSQADTSFDDISKRFFGSTKYGKALQQFNRDHPLASAALKQGNPRLQMNQQVFVPPKEILESRFADAIDNRSNPPASSVGAPIAIGPPPNSNPASQASAVPAISRPIVPTTDLTRPYRVPGDGQMLIEIAQQTLGDRGRWSEIYRLNPTLRPEYPIPGGTDIRLPGNANVP
jgi:hypothetical protein